MYLVDKSAFEQPRHSADADALLRTLAGENRLATCEVVAPELLHSTRSPPEYDERWAHLDSLVWLPVNGDVTREAMGMQRRLAVRGHHRPIPDLWIAATALVHGAAVLHYDHYFDLIAEVTGQPLDHPAGIEPLNRWSLHV